MDTGTLFTLAWRIIPRLPGPVVRGGFDLIARILHLIRIDQVVQLEKNLTRVTDITERRRLRRLSREGMRSYMRYYAESFQLPGFTTARLDAKVRAVNLRDYSQVLTVRSIIAGVAHLGNWDLAGAWSVRHVSAVTTVAETLEPESLFLEFLAFRESLGLTIFPYRRGARVFDQLLDSARAQPALIPLLADRDLTSSGITVDVNGHPMRVASGAARLALETGCDFIGIFVRYERLRGARRRAAGGPWGIVLEFGDPISAPADARTTEDKVAAMMGEWARQLSVYLRIYPHDWHMLQKCFMADLDHDRLARAGASEPPATEDGR